MALRDGNAATRFNIPYDLRNGRENGSLLSCRVAPRRGSHRRMLVIRIKSRVRITVGLIFFSLACSERKAEVDQNANVVSQSAVAGERIPSGNYLGSFAT